MAIYQFDPQKDEPDKLRNLIGPGQIENTLRQGIQMCWMSLPAGKRNLDEVEGHIRRILDRIFKNLREDQQALFE